MGEDYDWPNFGNELEYFPALRNHFNEWRIITESYVWL